MSKRVAFILVILVFSNLSARAQTKGRQRQVNAQPASEVTVTIQEQFFNLFLDTMFAGLRPPSFPLSSIERKDDERMALARSDAHASGQQCASVIVLERETDGVRTAVRFEEGRIVAPVAFSGSYSSTLLGCLNFRGWADTTMGLEFDRERQTLSGRVVIRDIHLNGVPSVTNGVIVQLVQDALDKRINPIQILPASQLTARVPVAAAGGAITLRAREVRPQIEPGVLHLHIVYEFEATR
ncbi:MAG: hypothetical protein WCB68_19540 [Pyrinomonadaceae bacterium]